MTRSARSAWSWKWPQRLVWPTCGRHGQRPRSSTTTPREFPLGGSKVLRQSDADVATVATAGVTIFEALKAYDELKKDGIAIRVIDVYSLQPIDAATLRDAARATKGAVITVEDHYAAGGIGDAVSEAIAPAGMSVRRLAVREIPRSGQPDELMDRYGISARHIVEAVRQAHAQR